MNGKRVRSDKLRASSCPPAAAVVAGKRQTNTPVDVLIVRDPKTTQQNETSM